MKLNEKAIQKLDTILLLYKDTSSSQIRSVLKELVDNSFDYMIEGLKELEPALTDDPPKPIIGIAHSFEEGVSAGKESRLKDVIEKIQSQKYFVLEVLETFDKEDA